MASLPGPSFLVAAFYKFVSPGDLAALRAGLGEVCQRHGLVGTVILAPEGINGTLAGSAEDVRQVVVWLRRWPGLSDLEVKESWASRLPFFRVKIQLKREIVTLGRPEVDPSQETGIPVGPEDWNALLDDPEVVVVDARNDYEVSIGTFEGAIDPDIETFRDLALWFEERWTAENRPKVAMFCTGGIRCEKASALLLEHGGREVYQLRGGILKYLEQVAPEENRFDGDCFVFDGRVAVGGGLEPRNYTPCPGCGWPLGPGQRHDCRDRGHKAEASSGRRAMP